MNPQLTVSIPGKGSGKLQGPKITNSLQRKYVTYWVVHLVYIFFVQSAKPIFNQKPEER